jgi:hypothetical protein
MTNTKDEKIRIIFWDRVLQVMSFSPDYLMILLQNKKARANCDMLPVRAFWFLDLASRNHLKLLFSLQYTNTK